MLYDIFPFFKEFDILDIRLNELNESVDKFVLVESRFSHSGKEKPLYFKDYKGDRFDKFKDKIICFEADSNIAKTLLRKNDDHWLERFQRNSAMEFCKSFITDKDLVLLSDVDEIPWPSYLDHYKSDFLKFGKIEPHNIKQRMFRYKLNLYFQEWKLGSIISWKDFGDKYQYDWDAIRRKHHYKFTTPAAPHGWHFSSIGTTEEILEKFENIAHFFQLKRQGLINKSAIESLTKNRVHIKNKDTKSIGMTLSLSVLPPYVQNNIEKFKHLIDFQGA